MMHHKNKHFCHWPGCKKVVAPKLWGCVTHCYKLPIHLRNLIWAHYKKDQEINGPVSKDYLAAVNKVHDWINHRND